MTLGLGDFAVLGTMLAVIVGIPFAVILAMTKAQNRRIEVVETRLEDKVDRREWLREAHSKSVKIETIGMQLAGIDAKLDQQFGIAAAVDKLADAMKNQTEAAHGD